MNKMEKVKYDKTEYRIERKKDLFRLNSLICKAKQRSTVL